MPGYNGSCLFLDVRFGALVQQSQKSQKIPFPTTAIREVGSKVGSRKGHTQHVPELIVRSIGNGIVTWRDALQQA